MQPDNQQPGWSYNPNGGSEPPQNDLKINHSNEPSPDSAVPAPVQDFEPNTNQAEQVPLQPQDADNFSYSPQGSQDLSQQQLGSTASEQGSVSWSASAFIQHERGSSWYFALFGGAVLLSAIAYVLTKDLFSVLIFIVLAVLIAFMVKRKPESVNYELRSDGVQIGPKFYQYSLFKSFSLSQDQGIRSINLTPLKRFMPPVSMFYPPDSEDEIMELLGNRLPQEQAKGEAIDRLARKLRI